MFEIHNDRELQLWDRLLLAKRMNCKHVVEARKRDLSRLKLDSGRAQTMSEAMFSVEKELLYMQALRQNKITN